MDTPKAERTLMVLGGLLFVMLCVFVGSVWYAALSLAMTMLER
jgi:hypothetical protein